MTHGPRASMPSIPQRRAAAGFDIIRELSTTPVKLDWSSLLKVSPDLRQDMKSFLDECDGQPGPSGPPPQITSRPANPTAPARPPPAQQQGPTPMESVLDTGHAYHTSSSAPRIINTVVKAKVTVLGIPFEAIIDTGASDTVVSHSVVRKLGLMDKLEHSDVTFVSANGRTETPMGILKELPIGVGNLRLPIDAMVTAADSYNVLVGNDYLRMAQADICLSSNTLRVRLGLDQYEEVPISEASGSKLINALAPLPMASPVAIEEVDFKGPVDAIQQHFARLSALKQEGIRQQAELEANRRSNAMLMGYVDSSTGSEPQIQPNLAYEGQCEDADDPIAMQQQTEVAVADPQEYGNMPELVTSDDEDDWDAHALTSRQKLTPLPCAQ